MGDGILGNPSRILPIPLLKQLDPTLAILHSASQLFLQLAQIPHMHSQLFDRTGAERIARGDQDAEPVLQ